MRKLGKTILWPQYFDSNRSYRMGRRLSKESAIPLPKVDELAEAAIALKYTVEIDPIAKYPRSWWDPPGRLLIDTHGQKKKFVMEKLAKKIVTLRIQKKAEEKNQKGKKKKKKKKRT
ncbi:MAG: hypothetical protein GY870_19420 [archaeon]|nr:hypothetical protein [archaeon]